MSLWASSEWLSMYEHFLRHSDGRCTVVPVHRGETIGRGLLAQILRDCEITREEFQEEL